MSNRAQRRAAKHKGKNGKRGRRRAFQGGRLGQMVKDNCFGSWIAGGNPTKKRHESDFYPTPKEVTQALLNFLELRPGTRIWEPACGDGKMVDVLAENGMHVSWSDINLGTDFLTAGLPEGGVDWIITNPPFSIADQFIKRAHEHELPFAMLLKSQFWHAKKRYEMFFECKPAYILPLTWRPDFLFKEHKSAPLMDVIWCVWIPKSGKTEYIPLLKPNELKGGIK